METDQRNLKSDLQVEYEEYHHQQVSNFKYVKIAKQTSTTVVLEWSYDDGNDGGKVFKVVTLKNRNEWDTICWLRKSSCTIKNLEQNTCYSMKILVMVAGKDKFEIVDSSDIIKVRFFF